MWIQSVSIENFRGIRNQKIVLDKGLTILLGSNGSGKTTVIDAIDAFFNPKRIVEDDYHNHTGEPVRITMEFHDIPAEMADQFAGQSSITREIPKEGDGGLYVAIPIYSKFSDIFDMNAPDLKKAYANLRGGPFQDLPDATTVKEIRSNLLEYGARDDTEPTTIMKDKVNENTLKAIEPFVVEAKRDPVADAEEGRKSTLGMLVDSIIRNSEEEAEALRALNQRMQALYDEHVNSRSAGLDEMSEGISGMLSGIESGVGIKLSWEPWSSVDMPDPKARAEIDEHEFTSSVDKAGHGAQRLFLYAILRYYHERRSRSGVSASNQVIVIDEPELHQHPIRQDAFYSVLRRLAGGLQVVYSTHSDKFVSMRDLPHLRFFEKSGDAITIHETDFASIASLARAIVDDMTPEQIEKNLSVVDTPEFRASLFSSMAVLVEGRSDRAVIKSVASKMGRDLTTLGISVVPCGGKSNIREQLLVYRSLGIRYYVVWDLDYKSPRRHPKCTCHTDNQDKEAVNDRRNRRIFRYMGMEPPATIEQDVTESYSCLHGNMNDLVDSVGEGMVAGYKADIARSLNFTRFNEKNDYMMEKLIDRIYETHQLGRIEEIVGKITGA